MKRWSFITRFKIELLLTFSGCRKVPGKMPEMINYQDPLFQKLTMQTTV